MSDATLRSSSLRSTSRSSLNAFLKDSGFRLAGDLVLAEPERSETREVRRSEKAVVVTISTRARDRHGDVVDPAGVRLDRFRKNPVVLYAHDYDGLPVARSLWERVRASDSGAPELVAKPQFHLDTELSREVWALVEKGILSAWSVGFIPETWTPIVDPPMNANRANHPPIDADGRRSHQSQGFRRIGVDRRSSADYSSYQRSSASICGFKVLKWDLLEYSCVPVPANFEALTHALEERRITAPAFVKSLSGLGVREPDLVATPVRTPALSTERTPACAGGHRPHADREGTENVDRGKDGKHGGEARSRFTRKTSSSSVRSVDSVAKEAVGRAFERVIHRARGA
jgi:hypothetical protein